VQRRLQALLDQDQVHRVVAGHVPAPLHAVIAAVGVAHRAMHRLVRQHELRLRETEVLDELRVEVERLRVGAGGGAPVAADLQRQMHHQRAEERPLHDEAGARCSQLGEDRLERGALVGHGLNVRTGPDR
jgi:hypothetical protein